MNEYKNQRDVVEYEKLDNDEKSMRIQNATCSSRDEKEKQLNSVTSEKPHDRE